MKNHFFLFLFLIISSLGGAQTFKQLLNYANIALEEGDFFGAKHYFESAIQIDSLPNKEEFSYASCLYYANEYAMAVSRFKSFVINFEEEVPPEFAESYFYLGRLSENVGNYFEAMDFYKLYVKLSINKSNYRVRFAKERIKSCQWALAQASDTSVEIQHPSTPFNTANSQFGVSYFNDSTLLYTSFEYEVEEDLIVGEKKLQGHIRGMKVDFNPFTFTDTIAFNPEIDNTGIVNPFYYPADSSLYYNECQGGNCSIYKAKIIGDSILFRIRLPININTLESSNTQPFVYEWGKEKFLLFSSNREGGKGNFDIYYSKFLNDSTFSSPKNLGLKINSPGNELNPRYDTLTNTFYFSSDWYPGFGGFDVFYSKGDLFNLGEPQNIKTPINSTANDLFFHPINDQLAFFSSNRIGSRSLEGRSCCNDIYYFERLKADTTTAPNVEDTLPRKDSLQLTEIAELNNYLPVLYFPNNEPNPGSLAKTTNLSYERIFVNYKELIWQYALNYVANSPSAEASKHKDKYQQFITNEMVKGYEDLIQFADLLYTQLVQGKRAEITIKGYASPLASKAYNLNLTYRRIESMINFLKTYNNNLLMPYFSGENAAIKVVKEAYGELKADQTVSDELSDKRNAVYSLSAAKERRIEILSIIELE